MKEKAKTIGALLLISLVFIGLIYLFTWRYRECRSHDFSILYCLTQK